MAPLPKAFEEVLKELKETKGKIINTKPRKKEGRSRKEGQKIRKGREKKEAGLKSTWVKVDKDGNVPTNFKTAKTARRARGKPGVRKSGVRTIGSKEGMVGKVSKGSMGSKKVRR